MKILCLIAALAVWAAADAQTRAADAQPRAPRAAPHTPSRPSNGGPKSMGKWEDWQAATHQEAGQTVCYAFTRPTASTPALPGRGDVVLTVTERPGSHDVVALTAGFAYPANAEVQMLAEGISFPFYTSSRSAFARDGRAVTGAFAKARQAVAHSPGPRNGTVSDTFSLRGFGPAYAAITRNCTGR